MKMCSANIVVRPAVMSSAGNKKQGGLTCLKIRLKKSGSRLSQLLAPLQWRALIVMHPAIGTMQNRQGEFLLPECPVGFGEVWQEFTSIPLRPVAHRERPAHGCMP